MEVSERVERLQFEINSELVVTYRMAGLAVNKRAEISANILHHELSLCSST